MGADAVFQIKRLKYKYPRSETYAIDGIDLDVKEGRITSVIGANGCGKSTLFHLLSRMMKPTEGEILLREKNIDVLGRRSYAKEVAIVHQYNTATDDITVKKLVMMGRTPYHGALSGACTKEDFDAVECAMEITDTAGFADTPVMRLSGGQRQRVWLAMALAQGTKVLLLDEITTYLDIYYQLQLLRLARELNEKHKITIMMVMHDINQAMAYSHDVVVMKKRKILTSGSAQEVINSDLLHEAFGVNAKLTVLDGHPYCIYEP